MESSYVLNSRICAIERKIGYEFQEGQEVVDIHAAHIDVLALNHDPVAIAIHTLAATAAVVHFPAPAASHDE